MKTIYLFLGGVLFFLVLAIPSVSFAKESAGFVPGDFFYFLDRFAEKVSLAITKNPTRKAEKALQYAEERFEELQAVVNVKSADEGEIQRALDGYKKGLELTSNISRTIEEKEQKKDVLTKISDSIVSSKKILEGQSTSTPNYNKETTDKILATIKEQEKIIETSVNDSGGEGDEQSKELIKRFKEKLAEQEKIRLGMGTSSKLDSKLQDDIFKQKTEYLKISTSPIDDKKVEKKKEKIIQVKSPTTIPAIDVTKTTEKAEGKIFSTPVSATTATKNKFDPASAIPAIVKLKCFTKEGIEKKEPLPSKSGTGVSLYYNNKHYILTNNHVVTDYDSANGDTFYGCEVRFSDGIVYYADEANLFNLKTSRADMYPVSGLDIALLSLGIQGFRPKNFPILPSQFAVVQKTVFPDLFKILGQTCSGEYPIRGPKEGGGHYVFSFPAAATSYRAIIQEGITSEKMGADAILDLIGIHVPFVTSAALDLGSSGGAVVGNDGCFIGVASSIAYGEISYLSNFISSPDILSFIQKAQTKPESMLFSRIRNHKRIAEYSKIQDAIGLYLKDKGENMIYPQSLSELVPKYLLTLPKDVLTGKDYPYAVSKNRLRLHIGVSLEESGLLLGAADEGFLNEDIDFNSKSDSGWERGFDGSDNKSIPNKGCLDEQNPSPNPNLTGGGGLVCYDNVFKIRDKNECFNTAESYRGTNDPKTCYCSSFAIDYFWGDIWGGGNGPYTDDSNICQAAVHVGAITKDGGNVTIIPTTGCDSYLGVTKNEITSKGAEVAWPGSYYFEGQQSSCNKQNQSSLFNKNMMAGVYFAIDAWKSFFLKK